MDKGNKDLHRTSIKGSGLGRITETSKWGHEVAQERYGKLNSGGTKPKDTSEPQFQIDRPSGTGGHTPDGWLIGKGENGMGPNFQKTKFK